MRYRGRLVIGVVVALTVPGVSGVAQADSGRGSGSEVVRMQDDCDPVTFSQPPPDGAGPGVCVAGAGDTTFAEFARQLMRRNEAPKWRFHPEETHIDQAESLAARNDGGEAHTFTEVAHFGGGCVPPVQALLRNPQPPVPECADQALFGATLVLPGAELSVDDLSPGVHFFQCLIHPWMRSVVEVRSDDHGSHHSGHH